MTRPHEDKRYAVFPGKVRSINDGQVHHIDARQLIHLYGVDPKLCVIYTEQQRSRGLLVYPKHLIRLEPREDGKYKLSLLVEIVERLLNG